MSRALVPWRGLCQIFAYRTRPTQCVARLFLLMAYVGSLLIEKETFISVMKTGHFFGGEGAFRRCRYTIKVMMPLVHEHNKEPVLSIFN